MYLKSIEVQGFKSFANKIVFDFHNGITGIVGPNGSGKSNVGDAVRWVLGEQSARQLRGISMQDVIFAGTENRRPLSYAYVALILDNSDHALSLDFEEVTVARRVYRSGESEYLINGSPCRLKDVTELFYDTGIGKEGYSIIGQGQIERILNGKPEERRELFDEAAGIVKFKKRKATAQKKLENERENLVRVKDILSELERQVGPLEKQAEKAKIYLKKKEELKNYDVNMFLLETERIEAELKVVCEKFQIANAEYEDANKTYQRIKSEYEKMEQDITEIDEQIQTLRESMNQSVVMKGKLEGEINLLNEQIRSAENTDELMQSRLEALDKEKEERFTFQAEYEAEKFALEERLLEIESKRQEAKEALDVIQKEIARCTEGMERGKSEIMELLNSKASIKAKQQRFDTMAEQINIRKAQLNQRFLSRKSEEADLDIILNGYQQKLNQVNETIAELKSAAAEMEIQNRDWKKKTADTNRELEETIAAYHKAQSKLESLKNIAERYDGYGNSIRKVMELKSSHKGLLGVVSDLIQVEKKYETAIETALGGNIQNIITEDEDTAKKMIAFLKENRLGRATFLPLTSVDGRGNFKNQDALEEPGVIGLANTLIKCDTKYEGVAAYLLGRVIVTEHIDDALKLAKKYQYALHIVTLEGEYLSPGGSITGGAFKNSSGLLARNREIEELEKRVIKLDIKIKEHKKRLEEMKTARDLLKDDMEANQAELQKQFLLQNTAKLNVERALGQKEENETIFANLRIERNEIEKQLLEIAENKQHIIEEMEQVNARETEIQEESKKLSAILEEISVKEEAATQAAANIQMEEAGIRQKAEFVLENIKRIQTEILKYEQERDKVMSEALDAKVGAEKKRQDIEAIKQTIVASEVNYSKQDITLKENLAKKEQMSVIYKGFFKKQEDISKQISNLDKEIFRLNHQREKLEEINEKQTNYMWEEYELTPHAAIALKNDVYKDFAELKKMITGIKDEIRKLGDVNVNAIEEYKEVSERYNFLKTQHDDLIEAERVLMGIIEELDAGMRKQFMEKFIEIQQEFDSVFKELFGGGKGTLELVEGEDILECGIRINAQPPGKKLQNMMQMSGGEKSLTAICLLFAIQNLKPSPFCLLDEIEAALDDSNVSRFAKYLHKLTKNTQFIVITHRRGTMEAADRLYGITMQEKGVSTLVSVNLVEGDLK